MRKRKIVKHGNSALILLAPNDLPDLDLKIGDEVDIDEIVKVKKK